MFLDLIRTRRSIRQFQDRPVEAEKIDILVESVLRAPSGKGVNPWSFVVVTDPGTIKALSKAKPSGATFLANAPLAIVVCADPSKTDVWIEDASIASIYLHLAATDLGLGSCWIQIRERKHDDKTSAGEYVSRLLGLPEGMVVHTMIAIGYAKEEKAPHPKSSLEYDKISWDHFGRGR